MKTKKNDWFDEAKNRVLYGFDVFHAGEWKYAAQDGKPCLFETEKERDAKQKEFRKIQSA